MKLSSRFLILTVTISLLGVFTAAFAQYAQATDEVSLFQITNIQNTAVSSVRGVSDDGKRVVFESTADITGKNPDFNQEIFVYNADTRTFLQLTDTQHVYDPADSAKPFGERKVLITISNNAPAISGDGTKIVFSSNSSAIIAGAAGINTDGNQEIYLASLPPNSVAATFQRITTTAASTTATATIEVFDNYSPTINFSGNLIGFITTRTLAGMTNPDGLGQIVLYSTSTGAFTQVTKKNEADALDTFFIFKGFNGTPQLSGNGNYLVFISGFDHAPTTSVNNKDFNGEVFLYDVAAKTITQLTATTGFTSYPASINQLGQLVPDRPVNILAPFTKHISNDGNLIVFESAGDFDAGKNTDKTREVFLYNRTTNKFSQITTNSPLPSSPVQADIDKIDYNFTPGISPNGQFIFLSSVLNIVPVASGGTSGILTDNADASREVFRYDIANAKFRQLTYTPTSSRVLDQRDALLQANSNATGTDVYFTDDINLVGGNLDTSFELHRAVIRPVTETNTVVPAMVNAASFYTPDVATPANNPVAIGSIASIFGTKLASSLQSTASTTLPYELGGVSVSISGFAARLYFVSPGQINFLMPDGLAAGDTVSFTVNNNGILSKGTFKLVSSQPGAFTTTSDGQGAGSIGCQIVTKDATGAVIGTSFPAPPCVVSTSLTDSYLLVFGTGFKYSDATSVKITRVADDGTTTDYIPVYAGSQNFFPGLDQINLLLPADFPTGTLKLKITATNAGTAVTSNVFTVVIKDATP